MNKDIWLGLLHVKTINGNNDLGHAIGAVVNVAYRALDREDFLIVAKESFESFDFDVLGFEEIERGDLSVINADNAEKRNLLKRIAEGDEFAWGTFHTYSTE
ncbi:S26 family signal peptidase [Mucilaginibacter flavidus]|uniref:S26 family signal peptidase n=1 Tax=Mucilaginibacter flavidus TaxID=2949309 RepID=UPI002093DD5D|nr:S26 family signal peptidase [Mucilaginibacter flavidus]MCO5950614.1 S26 family signal peptidase [Mucilaginibacter flavidus]